MAPVTRGSFGFEVDAPGNLLANDVNLRKLRDLWANRTLVENDDYGPGVRPEGGAWHIACHLVAAGCVRQTTRGELMWLEISHQASDDTYYVTVTRNTNGGPSTEALSDPREALAQTRLLGFVEGTSEGHITGSGVQDSDTRFLGGWRRQAYDQDPGSTGQGGRVWEHWCTTRDLDPVSSLSVSLLTAYLQMCNAAGDLFMPTVARGRRDYGHPNQLKAMVEAGFTAPESARWQTRPKPVPRETELALQQAKALDAFEAIRTLPWDQSNATYFMYSRRIDNWAD